VADRWGFLSRALQMDGGVAAQAGQQ
jgi:hypothetical protein